MVRLWSLLVMKVSDNWSAPATAATATTPMLVDVSMHGGWGVLLYKSTRVSAITG
jgi:hypothetical protein